MIKINQEKITKLKSYLSNKGIDMVNEYRDNLRLEVDLAREQIFLQIHDQSDRLMAEIDLN